MTSLTLLVFLALGGSVGCHVVKAKLNYQLDRKLEKEMRYPPTDLFLSEEETMGDVKMTNLTVSEVTGLARVGDVWMWLTEDNGVNLEFAFVIKGITMIVDRLEQGEETGEATIHVEECQVQVGYSIKVADHNCSLAIQQLEATRLGKVHFKSDNPAFQDPKVSDSISQQLLPFFNKVLNGDDAMWYLRPWMGGVCGMEDTEKYVNE